MGLSCGSTLIGPVALRRMIRDMVIFSLKWWNEKQDNAVKTNLLRPEGKNLCEAEFDRQA